MSLSDEIFHTLTALSLKDAAAIRPLSAKEKSILEHSEAIGGQLYAETAASVERIKKAGPPWKA